SMSDIISKYVLGHISYISLLFYSILGTIFGRCLLLGNSSIRSDFRDLMDDVKIWIFGITLLGMSVNYFAYLIYYKAISITQVSLVGAIPSLNPLFILLFAGIISLLSPKILDEKFTIKATLTKIIAIFLVVLGSFLLVI
ncbi:MAG: hypothetical protein ABEK36_02605, partial [Candidatus Aenigmatarchaeota archaeon]